MFYLCNSSMSMSKTLPYRTSVLPISSQYESRTTLNIISLRSIGKHFQQEVIDNRIITHFDNEMMVSIFVNHQKQWIMVIADVYHLWTSMHELEKIPYLKDLRVLLLHLNVYFKKRLCSVIEFILAVFVKSKLDTIQHIQFY